MPVAHAAIRSAFTEARHGKARHRDIADRLGISEAELIAAHIDAGQSADDAMHDGGRPGGTLLHATRLAADWPALIGALEPLGEVMALTRNVSCVHEKIGVYRNASGQGRMGMVLGGAIDLRLFYSAWAHGFAVRERSGDGDGDQRSLQFFDAAGVAIHKIFLKPQSHLDAYTALVRQFTAADQGNGIVPQASATPVPETPDADIDVAALREAWASLRDTHEFFGLLKRFALTRTQALRLVSPDFVQQVDGAGIGPLLELAAREQVPIMVFVGNPGMIQIHSGPINKVASMGPWLNVLDPAFNLHLREDHIHSAWIVRKPTTDGMVTSVELFDAHGDTIAMLFGERKPGKPELCAWRAIVEHLATESEYA
jgi:putative hemin transport protein